MSLSSEVHWGWRMFNYLHQWKTWHLLNVSDSSESYKKPLSSLNLNHLTGKSNQSTNIPSCVTVYLKCLWIYQWFHQYWKTLLNISIWNVTKYRYQYRSRKKYWSQYQYPTWILQYFSVSISVFLQSWSWNSLQGN